MFGHVSTWCKGIFSTLCNCWWNVDSLHRPTKKKKVEWTLHVSILLLWILNLWISQNFPWTLQFSPSLEEMREILKILVSVKAILIYAILNKTIMFSRISSRIVLISLYNSPRVPQNSTSLGEKVLSWAKLSIPERFYFCARKLIYLQFVKNNHGCPLKWGCICDTDSRFKRMPNSQNQLAYGYIYIWTWSNSLKLKFIYTGPGYIKRVKNISQPVCDSIMLPILKYISSTHIETVVFLGYNFSFLY